MDVYTAFLFGVLVGQWVLLFAIWRICRRGNEERGIAFDLKRVIVGVFD